MEQKTSTFFIGKRFLFTILVLAATTLASKPAFSQVDYYYGLNKRGFRVSLGASGEKLDSSWGSNPLSYGATGSVDFDFNQFFSIGLAGQYGKLQGRDTKISNGIGKLIPGGTDATYVSGDINFKIAIGSFAKFSSHSIVGDIVKRIYAGTGIGVISSQMTLSPHNVIPPYAQPGPNPYNKYLQPSMRANIETYGVTAKGSGTFTYVPLDIGTYISLRKLTKKDKFELNPHYQYNFVQSPLFDGYQPSTTAFGSIKANGNQGFAVYSLSLRYKF